ncbi:hypothetical protein CLOM_g16735 [Closterium sp. NIES-68]|nr:hypothetical protein CLOM_g16735 [Closterium sp. NIES-68]GJP67512.1 hypothetical protein CLOP_g24326 [Closterium sp. NIES-67]
MAAATPPSGADWSRGVDDEVFSPSGLAAFAAANPADDDSAGLPFTTCSAGISANSIVPVMDTPLMDPLITDPPPVARALQYENASLVSLVEQQHQSIAALRQRATTAEREKRSLKDELALLRDALAARDEQVEEMAVRVEEVEGELEERERAGRGGQEGEEREEREERGEREEREEGREESCLDGFEKSAQGPTGEEEEAENDARTDDLCAQYAVRRRIGGGAEESGGVARLSFPAAATGRRREETSGRGGGDGGGEAWREEDGEQKEVVCGAGGYGCGEKRGVCERDGVACRDVRRSARGHRGALTRSGKHMGGGAGGFSDRHGVKQCWKDGRSESEEESVLHHHQWKGRGSMHDCRHCDHQQLNRDGNWRCTEDRRDTLRDDHCSKQALHFSNQLPSQLLPHQLFPSQPLPNQRGPHCLARSSSSISSGSFGSSSRCCSRGRHERGERLSRTVSHGTWHDTLIEGSDGCETPASGSSHMISPHYDSGHDSHQYHQYHHHHQYHRNFDREQYHDQYQLQRHGLGAGSCEHIGQQDNVPPPLQRGCQCVLPRLHPPQLSSASSVCSHGSVTPSPAFSHATCSAPFYTPRSVAAGSSAVSAAGSGPCTPVAMKLHSQQNQQQQQQRRQQQGELHECRYQQHQHEQKQLCEQQCERQGQSGARSFSVLVSDSPACFAAATAAGDTALSAPVIPTVDAPIVPGALGAGGVVQIPAERVITSEGVIPGALGAAAAALPPLLPSNSRISSLHSASAFPTPSTISSPAVAAAAASAITAGASGSAGAAGSADAAGSAGAVVISPADPAAAAAMGVEVPASAVYSMLLQHQQLLQLLLVRDTLLASSTPATAITPTIVTPVTVTPGTVGIGSRSIAGSSRGWRNGGVLEEGIPGVVEGWGREEEGRVTREGRVVEVIRGGKQQQEEKPVGCFGKSASNSSIGSSSGSSSAGGGSCRYGSRCSREGAWWEGGGQQSNSSSTNDSTNCGGGGGSGNRSSSVADLPKEREQLQLLAGGGSSQIEQAETAKEGGGREEDGLGDWTGKVPELWRGMQLAERGGLVGSSEALVADSSKGKNAPSQGLQGIITPHTCNQVHVSQRVSSSPGVRATAAAAAAAAAATAASASTVANNPVPLRFAPGAFAHGVKGVGGTEAGGGGEGRRGSGLVVGRGSSSGLWTVPFCFGAAGGVVAVSCLWLATVAAGRKGW